MAPSAPGRQHPVRLGGLGIRGSSRWRSRTGSWWWIFNGWNILPGGRNLPLRAVLARIIKAVPPAD
ncbi:MAG: hypothetical protein R2882_06755 [Gemmatimonadales bacterium]